MSQNNPVQTTITSKLKLGIDCDYLDVVNESYMHNVPPGSESHFKVTVVSNAFDGMRLIGRHRMINQILSEELQNQIHALAIHTYTVEEWNEKTASPESPKCMGGSKLG